ncbi:hypothetical protein IE53DRAFT_388089 [Violaceomyces palustris]|uniref:Uncharacterized protein n=1 Tax=Violaceomyces palustris TaxID=1673888 RepID=A0ACD0NV18_9BASI|nr:hypothetical protein IE53DRAFT_388089 [Violaceomyces palustris]
MVNPTAAILSFVGVLSGITSALPQSTPSSWEDTDQLWSATADLMSPKSGSSSPPSNSSFLDSLSAGQRAVFDVTMDVLDRSFQPPFLFGSPRYNAYYAVSMLARNGPGDAELASELIENSVEAQWKNETDNWYGAFLDPSQPYPSEIYPPSIYGSFDPNSNLFVATAFMVAIEEFKDLMPKATFDLVVESGYRAVVGDTYRVFGVDGDNLTPAYSNPWLMRCMAMAYYGNLKQDWNMTSYAERYAKEFFELFDLYDTLSEFNSPTYVGVSLYALSLAGYLPKNTTMASRAGETITKIWDKTSQLYQANLNTLGGSWDRTYGFSMTQYVSLLGFYVAALVKDPSKPATWPNPYQMGASQHFADGAFGPLMAITSRFHDPHVSEQAKERLSTFSGDRLVTANAYSPPFDADVSRFGPRNYTAYIGSKISVGGTEIDEVDIGGPAKSTQAFSPGVLLWETSTGQYKRYPEPFVGWMTLFPTTGTISSIASPTNLTVRFPASTAFPANYTKPSQLTLLFSTIPGVQLPSDFLLSSNSTNDSLPNIRLQLSGNVATLQNRSFTYDKSSSMNGFHYYNLTFNLLDLPQEETVPELVVSFQSSV